MPHQQHVARLIGACAVTFSALACTKAADSGVAATATATIDKNAPGLTNIDNPSATGSSSPGLTVSASGTVFLSWQERNPDSSLVLRYVSRGANEHTWSAVHDVNTGKNMLASATDVPGIHELPNGALVAIWRGSHGEEGYDVVMAHSEDRGATWSTPKAPHGDVTPTEHGFVSWLQLDDSTGVVFLDGRMNADKDKAKHATHLTLAMFDNTNSTKKESVIDPMICDCCHTSSAIVPGGAVVVYRDRHEGEIRDISVMRIADNKWRAPVPVHNDNWHISGCPVNGPSISAIGENLVVAWFTAANDSARVRVAFSNDTANTFGTPIEINEGFPDGKVGVVLKSADEAVVSWIERRDKMAVLRIRSVHRDGTKGPITTVAELGEGKRAGGAPKLIKAGDMMLLAWTDLATQKVRSAAVTTP
ncbi:MAG: sialidase family protein [Gemmatimonas sp.]